MDPDAFENGLEAYQSQVDEWFFALGESVLDEFMSIDGFVRCAPIAESGGICYCKGQVFVQFCNDCLVQVIPHAVRILIGTRTEPHLAVPIWDLIPRAADSLHEPSSWSFRDQADLNRCFNWLIQRVLPEFGRPFWLNEQMLHDAIRRFDARVRES